MTSLYAWEANLSVMRRAFLLVILAALLIMAVPVSGAVTITANASPAVAPIGDTIILSGTVNGTPTIAVFLFVTGPDLDPRGVALDNLNIPAGRGMFTTAPVHLENGSWTYIWDTSIIIGTLKPGKYTVYVIDTPVDRQRFIREEYATTEIEFLPSDKPVTETPLDPFLPVLALCTVIGITVLKRE
jgi:hypothetical protein